MFWGYSASLDLQNEFECSDQGTVNILLVGAADSRHILETIAKYYRHKRKVRINFYVAEVLMELVARQLLLLMTAFEPPEKLGLREKVHLWMEIYGNSLVRPNTAKFTSKKALQLIHAVTDFDYLKFRLPVVDLDLFKYKERDFLEVIFKFWSQKNDDYNIIQHWDNRLRKSLGVRYDTRKGVYDWDYHMKLRERHNGERINSREYSKWRETGIAFMWLETEMSEVNLTLTNGIFQSRDRILHHGFLGDQVSGPYVSFGLDCEDEEMLKTQNGIHVKRSTDLTFRNLSRMFWEIEQQSPYCHVEETESQNLGVIVTELTEHHPIQINGGTPGHVTPSNENNIFPKTSKEKRDTYTAIPLPEFHITFFPPSSISDLPQKHKKFINFFDLIWISQNLMKKISPNSLSLAKDGATILIENRNYVVSLSKDDFEKTPEEIDSIMKACSCEIAQSFNARKDGFAKYVFRNNVQTSHCDLGINDVVDVVDSELKGENLDANIEGCRSKMSSLRIAIEEGNENDKDNNH